MIAAEVYQTRVARLAMDIADVIRRLGEASLSEPAPDRKSTVVYLAECGYERGPGRQAIPRRVGR